MGSLLFLPEGRMNPAEFRKGAIILLALNFFIWPLWYISNAAGIFGIMIAVLSIYCWGCIFSKRLHDANISGWFFPIFFVAYFFLAQLVFGFIATMLWSDEIAEKFELLNEISKQGAASVDPFEFYDLVFEVCRGSVVPGAISFFITGAIIAFGVNKLLKTDPNPNRWG